jgi:hypothetical protein
VVVFPELDMGFVYASGAWKVSPRSATTPPKMLTPRAKHMRKLYKRLISDTILKDRMDKGTKRKLVWKKEAGDKTKKSKMEEGEEKNEENEEEPKNEVEEGRKEE